MKKNRPACAQRLLKFNCALLGALAGVPQSCISQGFPLSYQRRVVETMFTTTATPFVRLFHIGVQSKNQSKLHVVHGETFSTQTPFQTAHLQ